MLRSQMAPPRSGPITNFMKYPYPDSEQIWEHLEGLVGVKEESKGCAHLPFPRRVPRASLHIRARRSRCIANLLKYRAVRTRARFPRRQSAAVLVPLFVGRLGDLYVLLSRCVNFVPSFLVAVFLKEKDGALTRLGRRLDTLKAFSGDTALRGGRLMRRT